MLPTSIRARSVSCMRRLNSSPCLFDFPNRYSRSSSQVISYGSTPLNLLAPAASELPHFPHLLVHPVIPRLISIRCYAYSRRKHDEKKPLANERLIKVLMSRNDAISADGLEVRMILDKKIDSKDTQNNQSASTTEVVSLSKAIQTSIALDADIIAVNLKQKIPVVKIADLNSLLYQQARKKVNKTTAARQEKEFRFKGGIADNDLQRKVDNMIKALEKGHNCLIRVQCRGWMVGKNPDMAVRLASKVVGLVGDLGQAAGPPKVNPQKTTARVLINPRSNR